jgi:hypothetical protein
MVTGSIVRDLYILVDSVAITPLISNSKQQYENL